VEAQKWGNWIPMTDHDMEKKQKGIEKTKEKA